MLITQQGPTLRLFKQIERELTSSASLAEIAQKSCEAFYATFEQSVVLVRMFISMPYAKLPAYEQKHVHGLAEQMQMAQFLQPTTAVMTLLGTKGVNEAWGDRQASQLFRAFPLISQTLVEAAPMTAQLLRVLGIKINVPLPDTLGVTEKAWGAGRAALFFVEHAARTVDSQGRKIIVMQPFVEEYGVQTVFGVARAYRDDLFLTQLVFCRHPVSRERAREFLPLAALFRSVTLRAFDTDTVFPKT